MRNRLSDLNNHLFAEIERLGDEDLTGEGLAEEIRRAKALTGVATQVVANASLMLEARRFIDGAAEQRPSLPEVIG